MSRAMQRALFWSPRVLCILFAVFVSLFAVDVFGEGYGFWKTILALLAHLVPTAILLTALFVSWRRGWIGAILFVGLGVLYLVTAWGRFPWSVYALMSGIPCLVGLLFLADWWFGRSAVGRTSPAR